MDSKGITFVDSIVGILIISILFITISNYSGYIIKTESNITNSLSNQITVSNLMEDIYLEKDWASLNNCIIEGLDIAYKNYLKEGNLERMDVVIKSGKVSKSYKLERSLL